MTILRLIKKVRKSKQSIDLKLVDTNKIVISDRFEHSDDAFKYFIGYKNENDIRLLIHGWYLKTVGKYVLHN